MKKKLLFSFPLILSFFLFSENINAQCGNTDIAILNANKIKAAIPVGGDLFWDREDAGFVVPYIPSEPETTTIFTAGLWLGGFDENGVLGTSCQAYGNNNGNSDYWSGPINDNSGEAFENGCENFDKVWKVNQSEISQLILDFEDNQNIDQSIAQNILRWPGQGNPHFESEMGFELPDQELAPFFDRNNNGIYEPLNGEYPVIDEAWPDVIPNELTWCVFNDLQYEIQGETMGNPVGVEVHQLVYGFNCQENDVLNQTLFTRHKIINKSGGDLSELVAGFWADFDVGCYFDDYVGCDTLLNSGYAYNQDPIDEHQNCDYPSYGENPPVQVATLLNRKMDYFMYRWYGGGTCDPVFAYLTPNYEEDYYNFLTGKWGDGTPLRVGEEGHDPDGEGEVHHAFPDNPNDATGWSMYQNWMWVLCTHWSLISSGPHFLPNNENIILDMAHSFHRHPDSSNIGNVNVALENIPNIQSFFDNGFENGCTQIATSTDEFVSENMELEISPNPNNGHFSIFSKNNFQNMSLTLFDINGKNKWNGEIPAGQNKLDIEIDENLRSGIYFLKSVREGGGFVVKKIIVN